MYGILQLLEEILRHPRVLALVLAGNILASMRLFHVKYSNCLTLIKKTSYSVLLLIGRSPRFIFK